MSDDLIEFLRARLEEDREEAERGYLKAPEIPDYDGWDKSTTVGLPPAVAVRVLAEVEAKRRIVDRYAWLREHGDTGDAAWVLPLLAAPYAAHPDFRPEWTPTA